MNRMLFQLGGVVITSGAQMLMNENGLDPVHWLARHVTGDWSDLDEHDKQANQLALTNGGRLVSGYKQGSDKLYFITEADRSVTTILRADEYQREDTNCS